MVDLLDSAGLFLKVTRGKTTDDGKIQLEPVTDPRTGVKLVGIDGRKLGIDKEYFEALDRSVLEELNGFKIFVFHGTLSEYKPAHFPDAESLPVSSLPRNFDYYAAGHLHERTEGKLPGFQFILYPGTLFGGDYGDLERNARGTPRGFYLVSFDSKVRTTEFVPISACKYCLIEYDASGKTAKKAEEDLIERAKSCDPRDSVVIVKVRGEISTGKTSDIDFVKVQQLIQEKGALHIIINRSGLTAREYTSIKVAGNDIRDVETKLFRESIGQFKTTDTKLKGENGVQLSLKLLSALKQFRGDETKSEYDSRVIGDGANVLGLTKVIRP